jgi:Protein of unknown function (DUF2721)
MDVPTNPFAILTFISAPAVLTNASCVLLFGTGNRYGRAIDRVHELADVVEERANLDEGVLRLRIRQLSAAETRTLLIVRALTCFYSAVAGFVASTLVSLIGATLVSAGVKRGVEFSFALSFIAGSIGVFAMITGAMTLAFETKFSFQVLREEKTFLTERVQGRIAKLIGVPTES